MSAHYLHDAGSSSISKICCIIYPHTFTVVLRYGLCCGMAAECLMGNSSQQGILPASCGTGIAAYRSGLPAPSGRQTMQYCFSSLFRSRIVSTTVKP